MDRRPHALDQALKGFLAELRDVRNLSANTVDAYGRDIAQFLDSLRDDATIDEVFAYAPLRRHLAGLRTRGREPRTVSRKAAALRSFGDFRVQPRAIALGLRHVAYSPPPWSLISSAGVSHATLSHRGSPR